MARRDKLERQLEQLTADFDLRLVDALEDCARGHWGIFGQNDLENRMLGFSRISPMAVELRERIAEIDDLAQRLGYERYRWCARFDYYRTLRNERGEQTPGEPKLAREFLEEIRREGSAGPGLA